MREPPTPDQRASLETLRYATPLLRLLRCEVVSARITVNAHLRHGGTLTLGNGRDPAGVVRAPVGVDKLLAFALWSLVPNEWLLVPESVIFVNHRPASGLVAVHHPDGRIQPWRAELATAPTPVFNQELGPLLLGALDDGGVGVFADWVDERTADWSAVTSALRGSVPYTHTRGHHVGRFRYAMLAPDAVVWAFLTGRLLGDLYSDRASGVLGFGWFGPDGLERDWNFTPTGETAATFRERVWESMPAPREAE